MIALLESGCDCFCLDVLPIRVVCTQCQNIKQKKYPSPATGLLNTMKVSIYTGIGSCLTYKGVKATPHHISCPINEINVHSSHWPHAIG